MLLERVSARLRRLVRREPKAPPRPSPTPEVPRAAKPAPPVRDTALEQLTAEARYARERLDLYTAKSYGPRATSPARLRELRRASEAADARLAAAKAARRPTATDASDVDEPPTGG